MICLVDVYVEYTTYFNVLISFLSINCSSAEPRFPIQIGISGHVASTGEVWTSLVSTL